MFNRELSSIMTQSKLILGNWKMHGDQVSVRHYITAIISIQRTVHEVGLMLPFCYLSLFQQQLGSVHWGLGAQDVSQFTNTGAYTGEVSARMLADCGVTFALVGHSERRQYFVEDDRVLRAKLKSLLTTDIMPVFCVGESAQDKANGQQKKILQKQLQPLIEEQVKKIVVAYEPVWAIGSGKTPTKTEIEESLEFIGNYLLSRLNQPDKIRLLYGGSVSESNAAEIAHSSYVSGLLVGSASLRPDGFIRIIQSI
jgi:triose-phosphate isomerase